MLDNLLKTLQGYVDEHGKLDKEYNEQRSRCLARYASSVSQEKLGVLNQVHSDNCKVLYKEYKAKTIEIFKEAYKQLRLATIAPADQGMLNSISLIEQIKDITTDEVDALYDATKNNYLANKKADQFIKKIGKGNSTLESYIKGLYSEDPQDVRFIPVSPVKQEVGELEDYIMDKFFKNSMKDFSGYHQKNILTGDFINRVKIRGDHFINRYLPQ